MKNRHKKDLISDKIYLGNHISLAATRDIKLSSFTKAVLKAAAQIPIGQTRSYQWVAKRIGRPKALRAVGQVLKRNPFPLLIPCHRIIRADGELGGYSKGEKNKRDLLVMEKEIIKALKEKKND